MALPPQQIVLDRLDVVEKLANLGTSLKKQRDVLFEQNGMESLITEEISSFVHLMPEALSFEGQLDVLKRIVRVWKILTENQIQAAEILPFVTTNLNSLPTSTSMTEAQLLNELGTLMELQKIFDNVGVNMAGVDQLIGSTIRGLANVHASATTYPIYNPATQPWTMAIRQVSYGGLTIASPYLAMIFDEVNQIFTFTHAARPLFDPIAGFAFQQCEVRKNIRQANSLNMILEFGNGFERPPMSIELAREEDKMAFCEKLNEIDGRSQLTTPTDYYPWPEPLTPAI